VSDSSSTPSPTVSVVLTAFKRRENLQRQINAIRAQTHQVKEILVWENGTNTESAIEADGFDLLGSSSKNLGVWARFIFALNASGDFIWVLDDDTVPGPGWLRNALDTFTLNPGVIGSRGLRFKSTESYLIYDEFGPNNPIDSPVEVDLLGHNWIFPTSWLSHFFSEYPNRFDNPYAGEDLHLSFAIQKHLGLRCYVPPHPPGEQAIWGEVRELSMYSGLDPAGISSDPASLVKFERAYRHYIKRGFSPICGTEVGVSDRLLGMIANRAPVVTSNIAKSLGIKKNQK
jgi:glycosyltransferase involved in cell wall biosynthesis